MQHQTSLFRGQPDDEAIRMIKEFAPLVQETPSEEQMALEGWG